MTAFDTNVLIYSCDKADPHRQQQALALIEANVDAVLLWQVACESIAASRKLESQGFTIRDAWHRLADFMALFPLVLPSREVLASAFNLSTNQGWSFWDAMIVAACLECGVQVLYSEDLPGRAAPEPLKIVQPFPR